MSAPARRSRNTVDIWPGFVDALSSVLMVFIFMLLIFVVGHFFLTNSLLNRDRALNELTQNVQQLTETLSLERNKSGELRRYISDLSGTLEETYAQKASLQQTLSSVRERAAASEADAARLEAALQKAQKTVSAKQGTIKLKLREIASLQDDISALKTVRGELEGKVSQLQSSLTARNEQLGQVRDRRKRLKAELAKQRERTHLAQQKLDKKDIRLQELNTRIASAQQSLAQQKTQRQTAEQQMAALNRQVSNLRKQLNSVSQALELSESKVSSQKTRIKDLGKKLNTALARKVEELKRYRSEFFGRLRKVLGERKDVRIVGDRFLFQSELLFDTAKAKLGPAGKRQLNQLAQTLQSVAEQIPPDIDWILRVDGHTDKRPIDTNEFPSNWELSTARAVNIVEYLTKQGIPPQRLAAAGFGEYHPLVKGDSPAAYRRNRRIELKLTKR